MNIKETLEKLNKFTEAKNDPNWRGVVDFDNIGCGFEVATGTSADDFFTLNLEGYSANSSKNLCPVSTVPGFMRKSTAPASSANGL